MQNNVESKNLRILAIGDCNTAGAKETADNLNVPQQFARLLDNHGFECSIQNLGYTMSTSREGLCRSNLEAEPCDILLLNFGLVDAWITSLPMLYISYYPDNPFKKFLRKMLKSLKKRLRGETTRKIIPVGHVVPLAEFRSNIETIISRVTALSANTTIILWGTVPVEGDEQRNKDLESYDQTLSDIAKSQGYFLDTAAILKGKSTRKLYQDAVHLSVEGSLFIAEQLLKVTPIEKLKH